MRWFYSLEERMLACWQAELLDLLTCFVQFDWQRPSEVWFLFSSSLHLSVSLLRELLAEVL